MAALHTAERIIREEHRALASVLSSILLLLDAAAAGSAATDFTLLRAMLFYVDEFPERLHHPKESELLFAKLRERAPEARAVLDRLDHDHARGEQSIRELQHLLLGWEMLDDAPDGGLRRAAFERAARHYVRFYLEHMRCEEEDVLPLARRLLGEDDWQQLARAFAANRDPLVSDHDTSYRPLFLRILHTAPAPIGLGEPKAA
ncbi:hemerythrin domain-containing protein [Caldimonas sp. KR1-144]|uniref:hemerythrin domain-containing protein n=1 Tax=Caldimonas sp. KR1-144 TaxID=3400911 RepID=UPI003C10A1BC